MKQVGVVEADTVAVDKRWCGSIECTRSPSEGTMLLLEDWRTCLRTSPEFTASISLQNKWSVDVYSEQHMRNMYMRDRNGSSVSRHKFQAFRGDAFPLPLSSQHITHRSSMSLALSLSSISGSKSGMMSGSLSSANQATVSSNMTRRCAQQFQIR